MQTDPNASPHLRTLLLLENYIEDSSETRKWLLELAFQTLDKIDNQEKPSDLFSRFELSKGIGIIQIDLIAKLMMYIEDLVIILEANRKFDGNYYSILDEKKPDVGERITLFMNSVDTLKDEDYQKMLCYENPGNFGFDDFKTSILDKVMGWNTKELKEFLLQIRKFRRTHAQIFRRYKHAGLPVRTGLLSLEGKYPYTTKTFDSDTIVFAGEQPMNEVIILPYSNDVKRSYRHLANGIMEYKISSVRPWKTK